MCLFSVEGEADGFDSESANVDDQLSPVEKLEKFIECEHSYSR